MKHGFRRGLSLLLACILSLSLSCVWPGMAGADETGDVSGSTAATTTFSVSATGSGSGYIRLFATKGTAYVADYDYYGNFKGYKEEEDFGFFRVQVSGSNYTQTYTWVPSAQMNTSGNVSGTGSVVTSQSLLVVFPVKGSYTVTVTPLTKEQINGVYWVKNRFQYWTKNASWIVNKAVNCQCQGSGGGSTQPQNGQVTVNCMDQSGNFIQSYTEYVNSSKTIYPRTINGYTAISSTGTYVTCNNGVCTPGNIIFYYSKASSGAKVTVYCYDTAGNYLRGYTETITASKTIYPQAITGYNTTSGGQYIAYSNGTCNPATVTFKYQKAQSSGTVTVYCYDTAGSYLRAYTENITASTTIYPQPISGYSTPSGSQYITYNNGVCSPATVSFRYQKIPTSASVTVNCYDTNGAYIRSYTETVSASKTIYPQGISGYKTLSGGEYITYSNGACNPNTVTFQYEKYASSATVNIGCFDQDGNWLNSYTETLTASRTIYPQAISGYNVASGGQYVTFANGACNPSDITFRYQKIQNPATLNVDCYDTNGNYIRSYTETITASRTVYPQAISGYNIASGGQQVTYSDGTCNPATISFSYAKIATPATLTIRCIDNNGSVIRTDTQSITADRTINPPQITGYTALSGAQTVSYSDGTCNPSQIDFQYQIGSPVDPGSNPEVAYPTSWDTQFKPGTAREGNGNENQVTMLPNIADDNAGTVFGWIWWSSESDPEKDTKYPELTAYFDSATVSSIGIRNGNQSSAEKTYKQYARPKRFFVKIYDNSGNLYEYTMNIPDQYSGDYQVFPLGQTYYDVSRIEFWLAGYYNGSGSAHVLYIADIQFYK